MTMKSSFFGDQSQMKDDFFLAEALRSRLNRNLLSYLDQSMPPLRCRAAIYDLRLPDGIGAPRFVNMSADGDIRVVLLDEGTNGDTADMLSREDAIEFSVHGRSMRDEHFPFGMFNILPTRLRPPHNLIFRDLIGRVKRREGTRGYAEEANLTHDHSPAIQRNTQ